LPHLNLTTAGDILKLDRWEPTSKIVPYSFILQAKLDLVKDVLQLLLKILFCELIIMTINVVKVCPRSIIHHILGYPAFDIYPLFLEEFEVCTKPYSISPKMIIFMILL
jgi:hypothetical protein